MTKLKVLLVVAVVMAELLAASASPSFAAAASSACAGGDGLLDGLLVAIVPGDKCSSAAAPDIIFQYNFNFPGSEQPSASEVQQTDGGKQI